MDSRFADFWIICGRKGQGKSRLARYVWSRIQLGANGTKLCVDPMRDAHPPHAVTFEDLEAIPWERKVLRWCPPIRGKREALERLCQAIYERGGVATWWDELDQLGNTATAGEYFREAALHGRHREIGEIGCTPRLTGNYTTYVAVADHLCLFQTTDPYDLDSFARRTGRPLKVIRQEMAGLPQHGYLWYHARNDQLYKMGAVPA